MKRNSTTTLQNKEVCVCVEDHGCLFAWVVYRMMFTVGMLS